MPTAAGSSGSSAIRAKFDARQFEGGPASTPTVDGRFVYTLGYLGHVHCLNLEDGRVVWRKHLVDDFGGRYSSWKYAGSPLVTEKLVIFDTGADGNSTVALDKTTGRKIWGEGNDLAGYSTPIPFEHSGGRGVLVFKARAMVAHDLATGRELWRIDWRTTYDCNASTPTVVRRQAVHLHRLRRQPGARSPVSARRGRAAPDLAESGSGNQDEQRRGVRGPRLLRQRERRAGN